MHRDFLTRNILWKIWLERNSHIFIRNSCPYLVIIRKIIYIFLLWVFVAPNAKKVKLEDATSTVKRSLEFLGSRTNVTSDLEELTTNQGAGN